MTYKDVAVETAIIRGRAIPFTISQKRTDKLFYIFDADGLINREACFTTLEKAKAYVPTMDHMVSFVGPVRKRM